MFCRKPLSTAPVITHCLLIWGHTDVSIKQWDRDQADSHPNSSQDRLCAGVCVMCKGLSHIPSSCLERAKGMRVKLSHLAEKQEWGHKHRASEEKPPQDLDSLLNSKAGLQAFRWFLRSEFSEENLQFWLACEEYKMTSASKLTAKAQDIYKEFINTDAPHEVNLDSETREALTGLMGYPASDTFNEAQLRIFNLMAKDSFPRFLRSSYSQQTLKVL